MVASNSETADANAPAFVHLKVHSAYSLLEGALPIGKIAKLAAAMNMPAVGLTDSGNLFGALEFSEKLWTEGIQPIIGCTLQLDFGDGTPSPGLVRTGANEPRSKPSGVIALLAKDLTGYRNLMRLSRVLHFECPPDLPPHVRATDLENLCEGLIALTGGPDGPIDSAIRDGQADRAAERLATLDRIFGNRLYVELQRHGLPTEAQVEPALLDLAYQRRLPLVATNEVYFASPSDYEAHDALLCIAEGRYVVEDDRRKATPNHDFKSAEAMAALFADLPEALANTVEIAIRCAFRPRGCAPILPGFVTMSEGASADDKLKAEADELTRQAQAGLESRIASAGLAEGFTAEDYEKRLAYELDVITQMKFPGYFLIVADFIQWSKTNAIPVGPGRGSGAGSLVAYALTITDLDPLRFGLLFERFLNPERVSMPDFDIDFCQDRRDEVIRYVQGKYGADRVAQIITHGKLQARAVLRDVGRVLQMPYGQVDRLCKLVPNNPANPVTLPEAIASEPKLQEERDREPMVAKLLEIAQKLEGLYRHASTHAAGIVISDRPLEDLVPVYRDPKSNFPITQFNWKMVEAAGLVKFDFLGLKTLTVLQKAVDLIKRGRGIEVDLAGLPLTDKASYQLLAKADTVGVFQLESTGMRESLKRLRPDRFEDIIAMVALYRPGPMDNIPTYINRKHGDEPVDCLHPMLEGILRETYGVIIYQEQVIQIAQVMGGYTLGQADLLRRAMGKKDKAEMAKQQARFVEGALAKGVKKQDAAYIFELVDKFAGYGFNKSHAAAYALVSYHTAYLKANYREEFLAASMTLDLGNTDKLALFAAEARRSGILVKPPSVNASEVDFLAEVSLVSPGDCPPGSRPPGVVSGQSHGASGRLPAGKSDAPTKSAASGGRLAGRESPDATKKGAIRYSLAALKNIGAGAVETIVRERSENGLYKSVADFAARIDPKALNKRGIETLAKSGAFDELEPNRARLAANCDAILALAQRRTADAAAGTSDLFGGGGTAAPTLDFKSTEPWTPMERLAAEFEAIGFYVSGHPLDQYGPVLAKLGVSRFTDFEAATANGATAARLAGIVISARERRSQKGNKYAFAMFSDATGQFEAVIFSDTLAASRDLLVSGTAVLLSVEAERDGDTVKMRVQSLEPLEAAAGRIDRAVRIVLDASQMRSAPKLLGDLKGQLSAGGKSDVHIVLALDEVRREVEFKLPGKFHITPADAGRLSTLNGVIEVMEV